MKTIEDKIDFLKSCAQKYETTGKSPISDAEYDTLYSEIQELDPNNPFFDEVGGLEEGHIYGEKVKHEIVCGSLNKSPTVNDFENWLKSTYGLKSIEGVLQHKVDGLSLSLIYNKGKLLKAVTRGDGITGVDVTKNAIHIKGVPQKIKCKDEVEIRGEVYKDRTDFYKNWFPEYANPRNFSAGAINQKDSNVTKERGLSFKAYEIVRKEFNTEEDKIYFLLENGFDCLTFSDNSANVVKGNYKEISKMVETFMNGIDREKLSYDIDGVVFKLLNCSDGKKMGTTNEGKRPKSNRAIKFKCDQKETELIGVEYNVGRLGGLAVVGLLKGVQLDGTTVSRVTLHNLKFIAEHKLNIGCSVLIQKSGQIIPYLVRKTKDGHTPISIPNFCPFCGSTLEWDDTDTTKFCLNDNCISKLNTKIEHYLKTLDMKGVSEATIEKMTDAGIVKTLSDIYKLDIKSLNKVFGEKTSQNILNTIGSVKEMELALFVEALGIGKIGSMAKKIVEIADSVEKLDNLTVEKLNTVNGFSDIKSSMFVEGWKKQKSEISELLKYIKITEKKMNANGKLFGKSFCVTGTLEGGARKWAEGLIYVNGGVVASGVNKNLSYLICGTDTGSKEDKAKALGIPCISEQEFLKMIN